MYLILGHTKLEVFQQAKALVTEIYLITKSFPAEERLVLSQQLRRAALSVFLNVSEGCSRKTPKERLRYYEMARGSLIEVDAGITIAVELKYLTYEPSDSLARSITSCFKLLCGLMKSLASPPTHL